MSHALPSSAEAGRSPIYPMVAPGERLFRRSAAHRLRLLANAQCRLGETFSVWLLTAGLIFSVLAAVAPLIDWIGGRRIVLMPI
jgi:hypothetical protein